LLLDNEKGASVFPAPVEGPKGLPARKRAVLVGQVWSADLAETLMEVYAQLLSDGYTLEDVSRFVVEPPDDRPGD
jgi:hypothetical protein